MPVKVWPRAAKFVPPSIPNVKRRGAVQVNRALRGEVTFGFAVRGTKRDGRDGREAKCREQGWVTVP